MTTTSGQHYANPTGGIGVVMPSGAWQPVMNYAEQRFMENRIELYGEHNQLTNISDIAELDRMLVFELMVHRNGTWLGTGFDYDAEPINTKAVQEQLGSFSTEIRLIKKNLGLDRPARERAKGEGSLSHYWEQLQERAKAFGINRDNMLNKGIELSMELISLIELHDNCADEAEREKLHCRIPEIIDWVRTVYMPEFQAVDAHFRQTDQRFWVRSQ